jgi:predicted DsbA family dithiol-disulfide isomerase
MKVGMTKEGIEKLFNSEDFGKEVREDEEKGYLEGVHGVPYFIINRSQVINEAVSKDVMKKTLLNVLNEDIINK